MKNSARNTSTKLLLCFLTLGILGSFPLSGYAQKSGDYISIKTTFDGDTYLGQYLFQKHDTLYFLSREKEELNIERAYIEKLYLFKNHPKMVPGSHKNGVSSHFLPSEEHLEVSMDSYFLAPRVTYRRRYSWISGGVSFLGLRGIPIYGASAGFSLPKKLGNKYQLGASISHFNIYFSRINFPGVTVIEMGGTKGDYLKSKTITAGAVNLPSINADSTDLISTWSGFGRFSYRKTLSARTVYLLDVLVFINENALLPSVNTNFRTQGKSLFVDYGISLISPLIFVSPILPYIGVGYRFNHGHRRKIPDEHSNWSP